MIHFDRSRSPREPVAVRSVLGYAMKRFLITSELYYNPILRSKTLKTHRWPCKRCTTSTSWKAWINSRRARCTKVRFVFLLLAWVSAMIVAYIGFIISWLCGCVRSLTGFPFRAQQGIQIKQQHRYRPISARHQYSHCGRKQTRFKLCDHRVREGHWRGPSWSPGGMDRDW